MFSNRIATADQLLALCLDAENNNRNRQAETEALSAALDPEGISVCMLILPFHNDQMEHRLSVLAKLRDSDEPARFTLDVAVELWERLPKPQDAGWV